MFLADDEDEDEKVQQDTGGGMEQNLFSQFMIFPHRWKSACIIYIVYWWYYIEHVLVSFIYIVYNQLSRVYLRSSKSIITVSFPADTSGQMATICDTLMMMMWRKKIVEMGSRQKNCIWIWI